MEYYGQHDEELPVTKMLFLPGLGRLVTLTQDNTLHLWETEGTELTERKSAHLDGKLKQITNICLDASKRVLLLGTEGGNIYQLNLWTFELDEAIIYQDIVMQNAPDDFKVNPGPVEGLLLHPLNANRLLIGYARGLIVLWDRESSSAVRTFVANQQLEGLSWKGNEEFVSIHNDGSYILWSQDSTQCLEPPNNPYGPYPCKAFTKVLAFKDAATDWMMFSGGMARASYGDKNTVTVMKADEKHTVFDLTSKVVDFLVVPDAEGHPATLLILTEEEMVAVDITDDSWPTYNLPYLNPIHASSITCMAHIPDVDNVVLSKIVAAGAVSSPKTTTKPWPVDGGSLDVDAAANEQDAVSKDVLITGHEDGSVKFWACSDVALKPLATVTTRQFFVGSDLDEPCGKSIFGFDTYRVAIPRYLHQS